MVEVRIAVVNNRAGQALLADIGGTNARFALADLSSPAPLLHDSIKAYAVADFSSLAEAARHYVDAVRAKVAVGVFAVAGRVDGDEVRMTNHAWVISAQQVRDALGLESLHLVNDFVVQSTAIRLLQEDDIVAIGAPGWSAVPLDGDRTYAVLGPGTGLGMGGLIVRGGRHHPLATEGGHAGFAPGTAEEIAILERLSASYGRVSNERLVSGRGLVNVHRALSEIAGRDPGLALQPPDITTRAAGGDRHCIRSIEVFCAVFGAIAGDLVLSLGAWDGVFLSGGMVPPLLAALQDSGFRRRFEAKGRYAPAMAKVPTLAIRHPYPGLLGAASFASDASAMGRT